ncbi:hypothetical protein [Chryseobacterium sp. JM1]|uniref:hypothetical protein n=1 Tax=Chryseobacterium sp. JM1 TaxID=1233950 RepID=UPI0004E79E9E|nr:hypothetical protein [Chryseobacterium sp. JM1]KFF15020.1 hypothetical protein IW22_24435 [Chryseobacterium sp. JM1]
MKKIKSSILFLFTVGISANANAQNIYEKGNTEKFNIKSPQLTDFERYGNIPAKNFVGEADLSIPLVSLPVENGNDINIGLTYNSSGFIPSKNSGMAGFNWSLVGEGVISREVVGTPDDQEGSPGTLNGVKGQFEHGLFVGIKKRKDGNASLPTPGHVESFSNTYLGATRDASDSSFYELRYKDSQNSNTNSYETTPDLFHFNFNGISGTFFMDESGNFKIRTNEPNNLKIDISKLKFQPVVAVCIPSYTSEIIITDDKGTKYYFGGNSRNLEYTTSLGENPEGYNIGDAPAPVITAWYMYKIDLPDGSTVLYNYLDDKRDITSSLGNVGCSPTAYGYYKGAPGAERKLFAEFNVKVNDYRKVTETTQSTSMGGNITINANYSTGSGNTYSITKKAYLESITYKNSKIKLNYDIQNNLYNNVTIYGPNNGSDFTGFPQKKLNGIQVLYNNKIINEVNLGYQAITTGNANRIFLQSINQTGNKNYAFEYDLTSNSFPIPHTCAVDYWGFYNGMLSNDPNSSHQKLIPTINLDSNQDFSYATNEREPNFDYSKTARLTKVIYPTKGYSVFEYEPHLYSKRLERRFSSNSLPALFDVNGIFGGTRIKKITDFSLNSNMQSREFIYSDANGNSTGILMDWPRYIFYLTAVTTFNDGSIFVQANSKHGYIQSSNISRNTLSGSGINYSSVTEKKSGNGSVESKFKTYIDTPDTFDGNTQQLTGGSYTPMPMAQNIYIEPNDKGHERGKLKERIIRNEAGNTLSIDKLTYNESPGKFGQYTAVINIANAWMHARKVFYYNDFLSKKETLNYFNSAFLKTTELYNYNNQSLIADKSNTDADNNVTSTFYKYAVDKNNQYLIEKNMIGIPLEVETKNNDKRISKTETVYPLSQGEANLKTAGLPLPYSVLSTDLQNVIKEEVTYNKYDDKGNLVQYTTNTGLPITIIWGYKKTKPIAKIEGIAYDNISSNIADIITASDKDEDPAGNSLSPEASELALLNALDLFRSNQLNYQVTTYTYDPLVGVRSITPPSGIREVYLYDTANRLMEIRENNQVGKLLKEYQYNYKN